MHCPLLRVFHLEIKDLAGKNTVLPSILAHNSNDYFETLNSNVYLQIFIRNIDLRPSCFNCPSRDGKSGSDITLADFWGIQKFNPDMYDGKGTSMVLIHTHKGEKFFNAISCIKSEQEYHEAYYGNRQIENNPSKNYDADKFWKYFHKYGFSKSKDYYMMANPSLRMRIIRKLFIKFFR